MATPDPLLSLSGGGLRVEYSTGRMLNTDDFQAEQLYHRSRLAHALLWLSGPGTVYGLNVTEQTGSAGDKELQISPGIAIDRAGRLVEVFSTLCIRLQAWLDAQSDSDLSNAFKTASNTIVADIFIGFEQDEQGKTPNFAAGDYDATDAYGGNRWLDSFTAQMFLRAEATPPLPADPWAKAFNATGVDATLIKNTLLAGQSGPSAPPVEYPASASDTTAAFLARVQIAATRANPGARPVYNLTTAVQIDNLSRLFVYPASLLARWMTQPQS